jgi:hypothetical protein
LVWKVYDHFYDPVFFWPFAMVSRCCYWTCLCLEEGKRIALPGANVYWLSGLNGVVTDGSGAFQLPAQSGELRLVASFVGYVADTLDMSSAKKDIVVELLPAVLDEVTVAARSAGAHLSRLEAIATVNITSAELGKAACCNLSESLKPTLRWMWLIPMRLPVPGRFSCWVWPDDTCRCSPKISPTNGVWHNPMACRISRGLGCTPSR